MTIAAKISSSEITSEVTDRFVGGYFELALLNAPGVTYDESQGDSYDAAFITDNECDTAVGGYSRQIIGYVGGDVSAYTDDGVALGTKAAIFEHDGGGTSYQFTHLAMIWGTGNAATLGASTAQPAPASAGLVANNVPTTGGTGSGLLVGIETFATSANPGSWGLTIDAAGSGYTASDEITISSAVLEGLGLVSGPGSDLVFPIATVFNEASKSGKILSVSEMANAVTLANGEEAGFYIDLKLFGFYS